MSAKKSNNITSLSKRLRQAEQAVEQYLGEEETPTPPVEAPAVETPVAETPDMLSVQITLIFLVDGQPVINTPFMATVPQPSDEQTMQLQLALDSRALLQLLEPHLGPQPQRLWTPAQKGLAGGTLH